MGQRGEILETLRKRLEIAQEWRRAASKRFEEATMLPHGGESVQAVREASQEFTAALALLQKAIQEQADFIVHDTIPADLKDRASAAGE